MALTISGFADGIHVVSRHPVGKNYLKRSMWGHTFTNFLWPRLFMREIVLAEIDVVASYGYRSKPRDPTDFHQASILGGWKPSRNLGHLNTRGQRRWSQYTTNAMQTFFGDWNFANHIHQVKGENPVSHKKLCGHVVTGNSPLFNTRTYTENNGLPLASYETDMCFMLQESGGEINAVSMNPNWVELTGYYDDDFAEHLKVCATSDVYNRDDEYNKTWVYDPLVRLQRNEFSCTHFFIIGDRDPNSWRWTIYYLQLYTKILPRIPEELSPLMLYEQETYNELFTRIDHVGQVILESNVRAFSKDSNPSKEEVATAFGLQAYSGHNAFEMNNFEPFGSNAFSACYCTRVAASSGIYNLVGYDRRSDHYENTDHSFLRFGSAFDGIYGDFMAGTWFSSRDALEKMTSSLNGNHIETIIELRSMLQPLGLIKALNTLVMEPNQGILGVLKFLADADLTYRFAIAPTLKDAWEISNKAQVIYDELSANDTYGIRTVHGKAVFPDLEDITSHFEKVTVVCRSKIRLRGQLDSMLPLIVPAHALGLLPTLSRLWDLVPLSWLMNYAFDVSTLASFVDHTVLRMFHDVRYSIHSISLYYNFTAEQEEMYNFRSAGGEDGPAPGYKWYTRFVIKRGLPSLSHTVLPIFVPTTMPDWDLVGSYFVKTKL